MNANMFFEDLKTILEIKGIKTTHFKFQKNKNFMLYSFPGRNYGITQVSNIVGIFKENHFLFLCQAIFNQMK